jgi:hypothetical protein
VVSRFVRRVRTASGAVAVQVVTRPGRTVIGVDHVGSARTDAELGLLLAASQERVRPGQDALDLGEVEAVSARMDDIADWTSSGGSTLRPDQARSARADRRAGRTQFARAETQLSQLAITRKTLTSLIGEPEASAAADATVTSAAYQQILGVFGTATGALRAKDVCLALGLDTAAKDIEGLRAKLKRLVARQILVETEPGLFTLAPQQPSA